MSDVVELIGRRMAAIKEFGEEKPEGFTAPQIMGEYENLFGTISAFNHFMLALAKTDKKLTSTVNGHRRVYFYSETLFTKLHRLWGCP